MNLAVADMTAATFFLPQFIFLSSSAHPDDETGKILCRLVTGAALAYIGAVASVVTLVAIATERYYAVVHPYENIGKLTDRKMKVRLGNVVRLRTELRTGTLRNYDGDVNENLAEKKTPKIDGDKLQIFAKSIFLDLESSTTDSDFVSYLTLFYRSSNSSNSEVFVDVWLSLNKSIGEFSMVYECSDMSTYDL